MTEQNGGKEGPGSKRAVAEYAGLRNELNLIQQNVRILWISTFGVYLAAVFAFLSIICSMDTSEIDSALSRGGGLVASCVLLIIVGVALFLGCIWQRHSYYLGSYLRIFHKDQWIAVHRSDRRGVLKRHRANVPRALAWSLGPLVLLAIVLGVLALTEVTSTFVASLGSMALTVLAGACCWCWWRLFWIHKEQPAMEKAWQEVLSDMEQSDGDE